MALFFFVLLFGFGLLSVENAYEWRAVMRLSLAFSQWKMLFGLESQCWFLVFGE